MLFPQTPNVTSEKTVLLRDDEDGTWIAVYDHDKGMAENVDDAFSGCSWMQVHEALSLSVRNYVVCLFDSDYEAQQVLAAMVARWGVGTVSGRVRLGVVDVTWCPGHYEAGSMDTVLENLER